jgi:hypothetical protein
LNILFDEEKAELFEGTGATMTRKELDAHNIATAVTFWDLIAQAYNNKDDDQFYNTLFDSPKFAGINP